MRGMSTVITKSIAIQNISRNVRHVMDTQSVGVRELGRRTGDSAMTISRIINQEQMPSSDVLHRIAEALGVSMDFLVSDNREK